MAKKKEIEIYAQGDVLIERVPDCEITGNAVKTDPDGSVTLAYGEVTGHRHRFAPGTDVLMFKDDALAKDMDVNLYIGHIKIDAPVADLVHEEHDTISLTKGVYRIRRQREYTAEQARIVAD